MITRRVQPKHFIGQSGDRTDSTSSADCQACEVVGEGCEDEGGVSYKLQISTDRGCTWGEVRDTGSVEPEYHMRQIYKETLNEENHNNNDNGSTTHRRIIGMGSVRRRAYHYGIACNLVEQYHAHGLRINRGRNPFCHYRGSIQASHTDSRIHPNVQSDHPFRR